MPRGTEASAEGDSKWAELHQHKLWRRAQLSMWFKQLLLKCPWPDEHRRVRRLTEIIPFLCVQCMGGRWLCERPAEVRTEVCHGKHVPAVTVG